MDFNIIFGAHGIINSGLTYCSILVDSNLPPLGDRTWSTATVTRFVDAALYRP